MGASNRIIVTQHKHRLPSQQPLPAIVSAVAIVALCLAAVHPALCQDASNEHIDSNEILPTAAGQQQHSEQLLDASGKEITDLPGGEIVGERTLQRSKSPYLLRSDLEVAVGGKLIVEPGVTVLVAPMVGITVFGALLATGTAEQRITFTTQPNAGYPDTIGVQPKDLGIRLVDGPSPVAGRMQLFHQGIWRSVCTNSRNWTIPDYETACRQLGFQGGRFWNWMDRLPGYEPRIMYEEPACRGTERTLLECSWASRQLGAGNCDYHNDIGIQCLAQREQATNHWRGLRFQYAPAEHRLAADNTVYESFSLSELRYVDIVRAGSGRGREANAAVDVVGTPPLMRHVTVDQSAYTGINITRPEAAFTLRDVSVLRSQGIGVFVNSSYGLAHLEGCTVSGNGHDGIRYVGHDLRGDERRDRSSIRDFCTLPTTAGQTYPIAVSVVQSQYAGAAKDCGRYFFTKPGYVLTVSFVHFVLRTNETAELQLFDGASASDRRLGAWLLRNSTRPQSVTSTREKIYVRFVAQPRAEVVGFLRITTGPYKAYDLNVTASVVADNDGRGITVDNLRSQVHVLRTSVMNNGHVAGVHVTSGAGDVNVTDSRISFNRGDGVNVTYTGGNRNVSRSSIASNRGYGVAVWLNQTRDVERQEYLAFNQTAVVEYTEFVGNLETGILHGNFCGNSWLNITGNRFNESGSNSVDVQTCWFAEPEERTLRLQIGHNSFENDNRIGVIITPALNLVGRIEFNHFRRGRFGALLVRNKPLEEFRTMPVQLTVQNNFFLNNAGVFAVSLGLSPYSDRATQSLLFTRNFVKGNRIAEPFGPAAEEGEGRAGENRLSPRSRVAAAVVISSSNVDVYRNIIQNLASKYEIGSQLSDQSETLNCTYNWLGNSDEEQIFNRLFHRKDRYDLAKIEYLPYLLHNSNPGASTIITYPSFVPRFYAEGSDRVGGEVDGQEILPAGVYTVDRDINVRPGGKLMLQPGVVLNFAPSVGMMVAGKLEARGRSPDDIFLTLKRAPVMVASADNETDEMATEHIDQDTEMVPDMAVDLEKAVPKVPVRLVGGATEHEGRLQVYIDGRWGTVCDYGWTQIDAALVCHQLGLALNPRDWRLLRSEVPSAGTADDVHLANVRCTEHDVDITQCRAERAARGEFYNSCAHDQDVGLRCYEGAWAGLRFGVLADRADLQYMTVEKAGLFDYTTNTFKPAVQMDFARHNLENVRVVNNLHDGLGIVYSDIYGGSINNVKNSEFANNRGNGISLKQLGLRVHGSIIRDNLGSGIAHDSVISDIEQRELSGWFHMDKDFNVQESEYRPVVFPRDTVENLDVDMWQVRHILTRRVRGESVTRTLNIRCQPGYVIGFQLLSPIQNGSTENVWIYDSQTMNTKSDVYVLRRDLSVFPVTSSSYGVTLRYESGTNAIGGVVLVLSTLAAPVQDVRNRIVRGPVPTLTVSATKVQRNQRGISAMYYNRYLGDRGEHYLRKANESIRIVQCEITHNVGEAFLVHAPFWDVHVGNLSEITVHINNTVIRSNGQGVRHVAKDLRSSNNLFHYVLQDTTVEANRRGGLDLSLPYVWQYNENFTHSVYLGNDTWTRNQRFGVEIKGHYAVVNITGNQFIDNECAGGLIGFRGMEKKLKIDQNRITGNNGKWMVEFRADSLSDIIGVVPSVLAFNEIRGNRWDPMLSNEHSGGYRIAPRVKRTMYQNPTCVIGFGGVQKVLIMRNLIADNRLDYDLVAGIKSARLNNYLDATENWWGSVDPEYILSRIFDFDDWNNHAEVLYRPFLLEDNVDASSSVAYAERRHVDVDKLGGRIFTDLTLERRDTAYAVNADITIMPDVTLTIRPGVLMEFAPNVGILVLGTLVARGARDGEIVMRPQASRVAVNAELRQLEKRAGIAEPMFNYDSIRLCTERNCTAFDGTDGTGAPASHQGFLEFFNHTTQQWVPICDRRFTERNAQVVCRELGYDPLNVFVGHDKRIEYHTNSLTRIWSWVQPLECAGGETHFGDCPERLNGQLYGRRHECRWDNEFVFVSCMAPAVPNPDGSSRQYWGGIRFANPEFERNVFEHRGHDVNTHETHRETESWLEFVRVESAGMLHAEKSPAVQTIMRNPRISSVTVRDSAHHGVNLVSPSDAISLEHLRVERSLGEGINAISLTGEGRDSAESSFVPLKGLDLPYHLFSLIDICDTAKEITLEERVIVYYKYDNNPVNCVKIFKSAYRVKPIGFRLLQSNLFNHSKEYGRRDAIHLFDGDIYNVSARFIGGVEAESDNEKNLFRTTGPILSVRLIASGAPARHGFFAEVVTLPISAIGFNRDAQHNISNSEIIDSVGAAISYTTAGEVSPILTLEGNRIIGNCRQMYGNFSTCEAAVRVDVQNMQTIHFRNNLVQRNQGGLFVRADSRGSATSLRAWIHNNLFAGNRNRPSLVCEGRQSSPYQAVTVYRNYFTQNSAAYADVIALRQVVSNFTYNYVHYNRGGRIVEISGFDKVRLPIYQTTSHNGFYDNIATSWRGRATVVAGTAGQQYVDNIFYNPDNDYEMITVNRSMFEFQFWNSTVDLWKTKIDARHNYWNYNETLAVGGRIRDRADDPQLLEVDYKPFHMNNLTVLDVKCPPGWSLLIDTCYMYVGAPMTFHEARDFCRSDNASLPFIQGDATLLWQFLQRQMVHLRYPEKVWVQHLNYLEQCTSFIFHGVEVDPCELRHGFICEIDPRVRIDPLSWQADVVAISVVGTLIGAIFLLCLFLVCWWSKSRHRHVQRLQRRNSIRQSLRSLNTIDPQGSMRRRNFNMSRSTDTLTKSNVTDYKKMVPNGSIDSMEKSVISESSYDMYDPHNGQKHSKATAATTASSTMMMMSTTAGGQRSVSQSESPVTPAEYNDLLSAKYQEYAAAAAAAAASTSTATVSRTSPKKSHYSAAAVAAANRSKTPSPPTPTHLTYNGVGLPSTTSTDGFELAYRNEGFRDNSTYGANTRSNSISNYLDGGGGIGSDDAPIIHQQHHDDPNSDSHSDYYGNSSTLPMRHRGHNGAGDQLSFLSELKHKLPEYEKLPSAQPQLSQHSSFLPAAPPDPPKPLQPQQPRNVGAYARQVNSPGQSPQAAAKPARNEYHQPEIRRPLQPQHPQQAPPPLPPYNTQPAAQPQQVVRPDSYFAAMRSQRDSTMPSSTRRQSPPQKPPSPPPPPPQLQQPSQRPKTVYESADMDASPSSATNATKLPKHATAVSAAIPDQRRSGVYARSKSEALLETNFDDANGQAGGAHRNGDGGSAPVPLSSDSRSFSQPLETAM